MNKIIDTICYNGEKELFEIRYNILKDVVDQFIVVEFDKTFSGKPKPWRFIEDFKGYKFKGVCYHGMEKKDYIKYKELAESSPNTKGAKHWATEFAMKESIKDALLVHHLKDEDVVFVCDTDEIWEPEIMLKWCHAPFKVKLKVYTYYLNNRSSEEFWGLLVTPYHAIKNSCLNHLRTTAWKTAFEGGFHFTSMHHQLKRKLIDSYTKESYATDEVMDNLEDNVKNNKDFLGRNFTYTLDELDLPQYILDNKQRYSHLWK